MQRWRECIDRHDHYQTLLSVAPPFGLIVRNPDLPTCWLALCPTGPVAVFSQDGLGRIRCEYHLVQGLEEGSDPAAGVDALELVLELLTTR